ncbi:MAG: tRNA (adenosine(37)-N6)-threonylcarbamoyltransferase complex ATPase subunit type 1 TsaE, partial [Lachnospiraceae bacterium]|nr:tRNA (adenosine(37)-N6)-threonylcarbamoyltransferase complex ATPase subunit type 1 TsaE [Lachnospiraceae bacterium]
MVSPTAPDAAEADRTKEDSSKADSLKTADRVIETNEERETYELGVRMGREARAGQVYTLIGDLGVGKTVFTKGLAAGLGIIEPVSSPTFTIVHIYEEGRLPFYHFDVYRIGDVEEREEIGYEDY